MKYSRKHFPPTKLSCSQFLFSCFYLCVSNDLHSICGFRVLQKKQCMTAKRRKVREQNEMNWPQNSDSFKLVASGNRSSLVGTQLSDVWTHLKAQAPKWWSHNPRPNSQSVPNDLLATRKETQLCRGWPTGKVRPSETWSHARLQSSDQNKSPTTFVATVSLEDQPGKQAAEYHSHNKPCMAASFAKCWHLCDQLSLQQRSVFMVSIPDQQTLWHAFIESSCSIPNNKNPQRILDIFPPNFPRIFIIAWLGATSHSTFPACQKAQQWTSQILLPRSQPTMQGCFQGRPGFFWDPHNRLIECNRKTMTQEYLSPSANFPSKLNLNAESVGRLNIWAPSSRTATAAILNAPPPSHPWWGKLSLSRLDFLTGSRTGHRKSAKLSDWRTCDWKSTRKSCSDRRSFGNVWTNKLQWGKGFLCRRDCHQPSPKKKGWLFSCE